MGFTKFTGEPNLLRKVFELNGKQEEIILRVYVDDLLICSSSEEARLWFMSRLEARFPVNPKSTGVISFDSPGLVLLMPIRYDRDMGLLPFDQRSSITSLAAKHGAMDLKIASYRLRQQSTYQTCSSKS
jgi:hypothetical protein